MDIEEIKHLDRDALADELAGSVAASLKKAIAQRGRASLVVSGGSTPEPFFAGLRRRVLDWQKVDVTLADERWVDADDDASNEKFVRRHLLRREAAEARFVPLKNAAPTPEDGCAECEKVLHGLALPFDVLVLGMGGDGHTASLFPEAEALAEGLDRTTTRLCLAVHPPAAPHPRMSLTLKALLLSRRTIVHITGEQKWKIYQRARQDGPEEELPIRGVLRHAESVEVWWAL